MKNDYRSRLFQLVCTLMIGSVSAGPSLAQAAQQAQSPATGPSQTPVIGASSSSIPHSKAEKDVLAMSQQMWRWMSERNVDALGKLYDDKAMFVHMGATMDKRSELEVIRSGAIQYKKADVQETSIRSVDTTTVVLTKMRLTAVVGGNEVVNPFVVTEVYVQDGQTYRLLTLSFTRLLGN